MPNTYTLLETITVGAAGAASVTFNSIPQTGYTDLVIKYSSRDIRGSATQSGLLMSLNGLTTNFTTKAIEGAGSGTPASYSSSSGDVGTENSVSSTANTFTNGEIYIPNYRSSNFKSYSSESAMENNATTAFLDMYAGLWSNTAAITSIGLNTGGTFVQHSTFSLYGVSALGTTPTKAPKATGGSIIQTDGTYWYHAFLSSGTFTPATSLSCDVLVVAGGGGGGAGRGAGGGAGGVYYTSTSVGASAQTVTIGAGGIGGVYTGAGNPGSQGSNSVFGSLTAAVGGGGGASAFGGTGTTGGSGGGAVATGTGYAGTSGQGFKGGDGAPTSTNARGTGGGGGAGAVGNNGSDSGAATGTGGAGTNSYSSWLSTTGLGVSGYIAGGGGGGTFNSDLTAGGAGGGGAAGTTSTPPVAGTANTGSGGGGTSQGTGNGNGAAGGSGLVIVRYLA
jgi:hypothetical protein